MSVLSLLGMASLGSVGALSGAAAFAVAPTRWRERMLPLLLAYSAGTMLSAALLGMIPRAVRALPGMQAGLAVLAGLLLFYLLERVQAWHHCHDPGCDRRPRRGRLIIVGDALHNFVDGVVIAAAFLTSPALGWAATLAVVAHEVPQEMGDFAVLVASGYSRLQALGWNFVSALATVPGALLGWWLLGTAQALVPWALALSAASFLYIALGDLLPRLHDAADRGVRGQLPALLAGVATIVLIRLQH